MRLLLGIGRLGMTAHPNGDDVDVHGAGLALGVDVGGAITENLTLYGEFHFYDVTDPTVVFNDTRDGSAAR